MLHRIQSVHFLSKTILVSVSSGYYVFKMADMYICPHYIFPYKNGCGLTLPTIRMHGMRYYYGTCMFILLASERSERDTIRGVQIRAGAVCVYICMEVRVA